MSTLINLQEVITDDWIRLDDDEPVASRNRVILGPGRLLLDSNKLSDRGVMLGVELEADARIDEIASCLPRIALVSLNFEGFADGRAFSQARLLRDRYAFLGIIRARGQVIRDQLAFMQRCGFDQFLLAPGEDVGHALRSFDDISLSYQPELRRAQSA